MGVRTPQKPRKPKKSAGLGTTTKKAEITWFFCEYRYKIANNRLIDIKFTVINRQRI